MELNEIKKKLALTEEQKDALGKFIGATRELRRAGVFAFEDRYRGKIIFINGWDIKSLWIGSCVSEVPEKFKGAVKLYADEIDGCSIGFNKLFNNYFLPEEFMLAKFDS